MAGFFAGAKAPNILTLDAFVAALARNGKFLTAFFAASGQYASSVCSLHSAAESMFIASLALRGLKCPFHLDSIFHLFTKGVQR